MTLEELKVKYQTLAEQCEKRGDEFHARAGESVLRDEYANAKYCYDKATDEYNMATTYMHFANELSNVTK